jgi:predicted MPP superfamily phosphohydrolase
VLAAYLLGFVVSAYGVFVRRVWFVTREIEVPIAGLDPRFDGYRIAHLSDLHIGTMTPKEAGLRWTRAANRAAPDLAVITGDLVTSGTLFYDDIAAVVGDLRARDGVFVSMGNHDYFGDGEPLVRKLRATGANVLRNEGLLLERGESADGQPHGLWLSAIDDTWTRRDDMDRALAKCPQTASAILLAHDPARFPAAAAKGVALTLSGHTHGGQVAIPFFARQLSLSHLAHKFHLGLYKLGQSTLYVHPGLGTTGPPMRLGVAPAVVVLTLRSTAAKEAEAA